jgi:hypothetical protein
MLKIVPANFHFWIALAPPPLLRHQVFIARLSLPLSFLQEHICSAFAKHGVREQELRFTIPNFSDWRMKLGEFSLFVVSSPSLGGLVEMELTAT